MAPSPAPNPRRGLEVRPCAAHSRILWAVAAIGLYGVSLLGLSGCSQVALGKARKKVVLFDYAEGRVVDVVVTDRLTGAQELLFVSVPKNTLFLEGYIQGIVTDYQDNPIEGIVVRAMAEGESTEAAGKAFQSSSFDPGVSDTNGVYRIRFSLPILNRMVDVRGKFVYNPGWEQEKVNLGKTYEPQMKESPFRLAFDERKGMLIFAEGIRKLIVQPVRSDSTKGLPGAAAPKEDKEKAKAKGKTEKEESIFDNFGFGQQ